MPGKRMLHKNICTSQKLSEIPYEAECLYYRLLTNADDLGQFHANPYTVLDSCMPLRKTNPGRIRNALDSLASAGLIHIYTVNKVDYLEIDRFSDFQILRNDVKKRIDYPIRNESVTNPLRTRDAEVKVEVEVEVEDKEEVEYRKIPPQLESIKNFISEKKYSVNPESFFNYYSANGWRVGKNSMKDWRAAVRTWESKEVKKGGEVYGKSEIGTSLEEKRERLARILNGQE